MGPGAGDLARFRFPSRPASPSSYMLYHREGREDVEEDVWIPVYAGHAGGVEYTLPTAQECESQDARGGRAAIRRAALAGHGGAFDRAGCQLTGAGFHARGAHGTSEPLPF